VLGIEDFILSGWDQLVANICGVLKSSFQTKFNFPFQKTQLLLPTSDLRILKKGKFLLDKTTKRKEI